MRRKPLAPGKQNLFQSSHPVVWIVLKATICPCGALFMLHAGETNTLVKRTTRMPGSWYSQQIKEKSRKGLFSSSQILDMLVCISYQFIAKEKYWNTLCLQPRCNSFVNFLHLNLTNVQIWKTGTASLSGPVGPLREPTHLNNK